MKAPAAKTVCWQTEWGTSASDFTNFLDSKGSCLQFCVINAYNLQKKKICILLKWFQVWFIAFVCTYVLKYKKKAETPLPISHSDWLICQGVAQHIVVKLNPPTSVFHSCCCFGLCCGPLLLNFETLLSVSKWKRHLNTDTWTWRTYISIE